MDNRRPGEDKVQRLMRLMQHFQTEIKLLEGEVKIVFNARGGGDLYAHTDFVYRFNNPAELMHFLEADQLQRILLINAIIGFGIGDE